jgi:probable rRNA maturation factor
MTSSSSAIPGKRPVSVRNAHPRLRFRRTRAAGIIATLESNLSALRLPPAAVPAGELSIVFLTDPAIARIHADFMADPTPTDVITFEGDAGAETAGEICVSADTAAGYARRHGNNFAEELTLYVVHGWLHLAGFDDLQPAKKRRMRAAEKRAMNLLRRKKAVPAFKLA